MLCEVWSAYDETNQQRERAERKCALELPWGTISPGASSGSTLAMLLCVVGNLRP